MLEEDEVLGSQDKLDKGSGVSIWEELVGFLCLVTLPGLRPRPGPRQMTSRGAEMVDLPP